MVFATLLDRNYISRASVMISSLKEHAGDSLSKIYVLALDEIVFNYFVTHDKVHPIHLSQLEDYFPELKSAKTNRTYVEYIFTLSPFLPLYILKNYPISRVTSLDSDVYFLDNPLSTIKSLGDDKIGITAHDFPASLARLNVYGKYNVSFQSFPATPVGLQCLQQWADDCIDYCGDHIDEHNRFADQKYLDFWQERFPGVVDFPRPYIGLAPWNVSKYDLTWRGDGALVWSDKRIVIYHFHAVRIKSRYHLTYGLDAYGNLNPSPSVIRLYFRYWRLLKSVSEMSDTRITRNNKVVELNLKSFFKDLRSSPVLIKFGPVELSINLRKYVSLFGSLRRKIWQP